MQLRPGAAVPLPHVIGVKLNQTRCRRWRDGVDRIGSHAAEQQDVIRAWIDCRQRGISHAGSSACWGELRPAVSIEGPHVVVARDAIGGGGLSDTTIDDGLLQRRVVPHRGQRACRCGIFLLLGPGGSVPGPGLIEIPRAVKTAE